MIEPDHEQISIRRQCELIGISRSSLSYEPAEESDYNLLLMRLLDEQYTRTPFYGVLKMTAWLREEKQHLVTRTQRVTIATPDAMSRRTMKIVMVK